MNQSYPKKQKLTATPPALDDDHYQELKNSCIDDDIIRDNVISFGFNPVDYLLDTGFDIVEALNIVTNKDRLNTGGVSSATRKRIKHLEDGGWYAAGVDLLAEKLDQRSDWGCAKPNTPRKRYKEKDGRYVATFDSKHIQKVIKYEHPYGVPIGVFAPKMSLRMWDKVCDRYGFSRGGYKDDQFWLWVLDKNIPIWVTEGFKKSACLCSFGYAAIGIPGKDNGAICDRDGESKIKGYYQLIPHLQRFATNDRIIYIALDNDTEPRKKEAVIKSARRLANCFKREDCEVFICDWKDYPEKGIDDLVFTHGSSIIDELEKNAKKFASWQEIEEKFLNRNRVKADLEINEKYVSSEKIKEGIERGEAILIKAPMGSGKTFATSQALKSLGIAHISIGYRNTLLLQWCSDPELDTKCYHLHEHLLSDSKGQLLLKEGDTNISLCGDSLLHIPANKEYLENKVLVIDEVESVVNHLLLGNTISKRKQRLILDHFQKILMYVKSVILLDGNLTDKTVRLIKELCPTKKITVIDYKCNIERPEIHILDGYLEESKFINNPRKSLICSMMASVADSGNLAIASDSQIFLEALESLLIESGKKGIRLDSKTINDPKTKEIIKDFDGYIERERPQYILYSPTAESGLNVAIKGYFKYFFGYFVGVVSSGAVAQMIMRIRDPKLSRYLFINKIKINTNEDIYNRLQSRYIESQLSGIENPENYRKKLLEVVNHDPYYQWVSHYSKTEGMSQYFYRDSIISLLKDKGHKIKNIILESCDQESFNRVKDAVLSVKKQNAIDIFHADDKYINADFSLRLSFDASNDERNAVEKARFLQRLPGIRETKYWLPSLILLCRYQNPKILSSLERRFFLNNQEKLVKITREEIEEQVKYSQETGTLLNPWRDKVNLIVVKALEKLGVKEWISQAVNEVGELNDYFFNQVYDKNHPIIQQIYRIGKYKVITEALNKKPGKCIIKYVQFVLGLIGCQLISEVVRDGKDLKRVYRFNRDNFDELNQALLTCLEKQILQRVDKIKDREDREVKEDIFTDNLGDNQNMDLSQVDMISSENQLSIAKDLSRAKDIPQFNIICNAYNYLDPLYDDYFLIRCAYKLKGVEKNRVLAMFKHRSDN